MCTQTARKPAACQAFLEPSRLPVRRKLNETHKLPKSKTSEDPAGEICPTKGVSNESSALYEACDGNLGPGDSGLGVHPQHQCERPGTATPEQERHYHVDVGRPGHHRHLG